VSPQSPLDRILDFLRRTEDQRRAIAAHSSPDHQLDLLISETLQHLRGKGPVDSLVTLGTLSDGRHAGLALDRLVGAHGLISGSTGSGKSRFLASVIMALLLDMRHDISIEALDPKSETAILIRRSIAAAYKTGSDGLRSWLASHTYFIGLSPDRVTLTPLFRPQAGISSALAAHMIADAIVSASPEPFTRPMEECLRQLCRVIIELGGGAGLNARFVTRLLNDPKYSRRISDRIADPDVREYLRNIGNIPKNTRAAVIRRIRHRVSFPEVRAAEGVPVADVPVTIPYLDKPGIVLGDFGPHLSIPASLAGERATLRLVDLLLRAAKRDRKLPAFLILEEVPNLLGQGSLLLEPLSIAVRCLRSSGVSLNFITQALGNLPREFADLLLLNASWLAAFRGDRDSSVVYSMAPTNSAVRRFSEADRRRAFERHMKNLERRHYYFWFKGTRVALPLRTPEFPDPWQAAGVSAQELDDLFDREIASRSMVSLRHANELIERWEAEFVDNESNLPPPQDPIKPREPVIGSVNDLITALRRKEEE